LTLANNFTFDLIASDSTAFGCNNLCVIEPLAIVKKPRNFHFKTFLGSLRKIACQFTLKASENLIFVSGSVGGTDLIYETFMVQRY
jgi:hypothetical protein